jgi:hypothetical protein
MRSGCRSHKSAFWRHIRQVLAIQGGAKIGKQQELVMRAAEENIDGLGIF